MTNTERDLLTEVRALVCDVPEECTDNDINIFNDKLTFILAEYGITLNHYHNLLLEEVDEMVAYEEE